jgi:hypothetical protein
MQTNALLLSVPLARWLACWMVASAVLFGAGLLGGHVFSMPRIDSLLAFTGVTAVSHAIQLRWAPARRSPSFGLIMLVAAAFVMALLNGLLVPLETVARALTMITPFRVGLVTVAAAAALNYDSLTRRGATYRPGPAGFGVPAPGRP